MDSLSMSGVLRSGGESCTLISGSHILTRNDLCINDPSKSLCKSYNGVWLKPLEQSWARSRCTFCVFARIRKGQKHEYPWPSDIDPNIKSGYLNYLSHFKPVAEKPKPVALDFEKPLVDLEKKIIDALKDLYTHLTPIQRLNIARHPNRPTFLDHVFNITDKWVELHGDRAGYDDPAIVNGIGSIKGKIYMFMGHQKGRNTKNSSQLWNANTTWISEGLTHDEIC